MLLIFSSTDYVFGLLIWWLNHLLFLSWMCPPFWISHPLPLLPPFAILVFSSDCIIIDLFPPYATLVFSSVLGFIYQCWKPQGQHPLLWVTILSDLQQVGEIPFLEDCFQHAVEACWADRWSHRPVLEARYCHGKPCCCCSWQSHCPLCHS